MDCTCGKFGDCSFSRFGFIVRTDRQRESHTHTHTHTEREREREKSLNICTALLLQAKQSRERLVVSQRPNQIIASLV